MFPPSIILRLVLVTESGSPETHVQTSLQHDSGLPQNGNRQEPMNMKPVQLKALLAATLEASIHQLVYVLNVYPSSSFTKCIFLGIVGQRNQHKGVVNYISNCIRMALPLLRHDTGAAVVVQAGSERAILRLNLDGDGTVTSIESRLRSLILKVHGMKQNKKKEQSFCIQLLPSSTDCQEVIYGLETNQWKQISHTNQQQSQSLATSSSKVRPIYACGGISLHSTCPP